jgi:hypothetical protein
MVNDTESPAQDSGADTTMPEVRDSGTGGEATVSGSDATRPPADTGTPPPPDTGMPPGPDSGPPGPFCATLSPTPLFCADFDEGSPTAGFSPIHTTGGSLSLDSAEFVTSPGALLAQSSAIAAGGVVDTTVYRSFALSGQTLTATLDWDVRVDQADAAGGVAVLGELALHDAGGDVYFLQLQVTSNGGAPLSCNLPEVYVPSTGGAGAYTAHPASATIALSRWTHVTLSMTAPFAGGAGTATLSLDGMQAESTPISVAVSGFTPSFGIGLPYASGPSQGWTAVFDDVVLDATAN